MPAVTTEERPLSLLRITAALASLAGVAASLTVLYLGMRAVMDIGGACASGGPFVPVQPCPTGVPGLMIGGIWAGLAFAFSYAFFATAAGIPSLVGLIWPALFLSLGWNFLEYGVNPPDSGGVIWGWLIPGVVFVLMGGIPLWWALRSLGKPAGSGVRSLLAPPGGAPVMAMMRDLRRPRPSPKGEGVVAELERLDALRRSGAIDDGEYRAAKRRLLGEEGRG